VAFLQISTVPPYFQPVPPVVEKLSGTGPNTDRQSSSHPHQVTLHPDRPELLVPDLGSDKTWRFVEDDAGLWKPSGYVQYDSGAGPRHVAVHGTHLLMMMASL
jgi:6-phosphogluconolactonase (cycloisomerase 2 family)